MATMVEFYRDVVGFPLEWDGVDASVIMEHDGLRFYLYGRSDFEILTDQHYTYPSGINGTFELALAVETPDEVDKEYHRMVSKGATPIIEPKAIPHNGTKKQHRLPIQAKNGARQNISCKWNFLTERNQAKYDGFATANHSVSSPWLHITRASV